VRRESRPVRGWLSCTVRVTGGPACNATPCARLCLRWCGVARPSRVAEQMAALPPFEHQRAMYRRDNFSPSPRYVFNPFTASRTVKRQAEHWHQGRHRRAERHRPTADGVGHSCCSNHIAQKKVSGNR
jgi:hypothetical protein